MQYVTPEQYDVANKNGISNNNVYSRLYQNKGWTIEKAITVPLKKNKWLDIAINNGITRETYRSRKRLGWTDEEAASEPLARKWSEEDLEYLCKYYETDGASSLSHVLHRNPRAVSYKYFALKRQGKVEFYKNINKYW